MAAAQRLPPFYFWRQMDLLLYRQVGMCYHVKKQHPEVLYGTHHCIH